MDVDGVEVVGDRPVIFYEIKTIPRDLFSAVVRGEDTKGVREDFWGRVNVWQLQVLRWLTREIDETAYLIFTPPHAQAFAPFEIRLTNNKTGGYMRQLGLWPVGIYESAGRPGGLDGRRLTGCSNFPDNPHDPAEPRIRPEFFMPPDTWARFILEKRARILGEDPVVRRRLAVLDAMSDLERRGVDLTGLKLEIP